MSNATDSSFQKEVLESSTPVLVDFWAPWCGPCKMLAPILEELQKDLKDTVKIVKVDVDQNPATASAYNIRSIPTLMLFKGGVPLDTKMGMNPKNRLQEWIDATIR